MKRNLLITTLPIALLFSFRMLGLFMLVPIFSLYALHLKDATPTLVGIALGAYGLSQGILQMPFGILSDQFSRKKMIAIGLVLLIIGSILGSLTHSIYGMIIARILQGSGAIGSVLIALLADITLDKDRSLAMAMVGMTIGVSFSAAMVIGPTLANLFGFTSIFIFTGALGLLGIFILYYLVPDASVIESNIPSSSPKGRLKEVLKDKQLLQFDLGIFFQHAILTATFFYLPFLLQKRISDLALESTWKFYLPLMVGAFLCMAPVLRVAERRAQTQVFFIAAIIITSISQLLLYFVYDHWLPFCLSIFSYFVAFNLLEAFLPSMISKQAPAYSKGTAMGVYSTCQFLGIFAGGSLGGILFHTFGGASIFIANATLGLIWLTTSITIFPAYSFGIAGNNSKP